MRLYLSGMIFVVVALAAPVASAAMVEFGDGDFAPGPAVCNESLGAAGSGSEIAGYELVKDVRGGPDGFTCFQHKATGGNPGAWAASTLAPAGGQIIACMFKDDAVYDPAFSGGFAYIDFTEDGICPGGGVQCVSSGVCVRQGGNLYIARTDFVPESVWTPKAAFGLSPADFTWLSGPGPAVFLDFGPTGAPLQFGFYRARSAASPIVTGTDNWRVVTQDACGDDAACDDANGCTVESCVAGVCERAPLDCDDGDGCTDDVCEAGVCAHPARVCNDDNNCTADTCALGECQYLPSADFGTVSEEIDALLAILEGPACGEEVLKRSFLKKFTKKLKKARGKTNRADQIEDVLKLPGFKEKAAALLEKARFFLAAQVEKGTISAECGQALTEFVYRIDGCLAFVPVG
jgi:hypothetical protein